MGIRTKFNPLGGSKVYEEDKQFIISSSSTCYGYAFRNGNELRVIPNIKSAGITSTSPVYKISNVKCVASDFVFYSQYCAYLFYIDTQNKLKYLKFAIHSNSYYDTPTEVVELTYANNLIKVESLIGEDKVLKLEVNNTGGSGSLNGTIHVICKERIVYTSFSMTTTNPPYTLGVYTNPGAACTYYIEGYFPESMPYFSTANPNTRNVFNNEKYSPTLDEIYSGTTGTGLSFYKTRAPMLVQNPRLSSNGTYGAGNFSISASSQYTYTLFDGNTTSSPTYLSYVQGIYFPNTILKQLIFYTSSVVNSATIAVYGKSTEEASWNLIQENTINLPKSTASYIDISNSAMYSFYKITSTKTLSLYEVQMFGLQEADRPIYEL